jgi:quinol monooxygenase YgiN
MRFDPRDHEQIRDILTQLAAASRAEPGCVSYIPHFIDGDSNTVLIYEQYKDEAALEFHRGTPHFKKWAIGGLYQRMLDRQLETLLAVG